MPVELIPAKNDKIPALFEFDTGGTGFTKTALGVNVERFIDLYHKWLSEQYGLKKIDGAFVAAYRLAFACNSMEELRRKMAESTARYLYN